MGPSPPGGGLCSPVCLAIFMLLLDITIVNVALPDIRGDLDSSGSRLSDALSGTPLPAGVEDELAAAVSSGGLQAAAQAAPPQARDALIEAARRAAVVALAGGILALALVRRRDFVAAPSPEVV